MGTGSFFTVTGDVAAAQVAYSGRSGAWSRFIRKCTLAEIQHTPYFYTLHSLALRGVDTFDLQLRMLSKPEYSVFIVQHALTSGRITRFYTPFSFKMRPNTSPV